MIEAIRFPPRPPWYGAFARSLETKLDIASFYKEANFRYKSWDDLDVPKFYYGSHSSSAGIVLFYLLCLATLIYRIKNFRVASLTMLIVSSKVFCSVILSVFNALKLLNSWAMQKYLVTHIRGREERC
ncbi:hypothetical protein VNO77_16469 [Canavalia gladiata]|uniref:Uncharacterized protein n=1 Tax=Canavalia gladiata TaxID=3824 RepID=A0AAN9M127_CANGL